MSTPRSIFKISILSIALVFATGLGQLAVAQDDSVLISYQGYLTDETGEPVTRNPSLTFTIYDAGGVSKWSETHPSVGVTNGLFGVILGSQTAMPDSVFNGEDRFLGISVDGDDEIVPRTQLTSAPGAAVSRRVVGDIVTAPGLVTLMNHHGVDAIELRAEPDSIRFYIQEVGLTEPSDPISNQPIKIMVTTSTSSVDVCAPVENFEMGGSLQIDQSADESGLILTHGLSDSGPDIVQLADATSNSLLIHPPEPCVPPESCDPAIELTASDSSSGLLLRVEEASSGAVSVVHTEAKESGVVAGAYCLPADHQPGDPPPTGWEQVASLYVTTGGYHYWNSEDGSTVWAKTTVVPGQSMISCESRSASGDSTVVAMEASNSVAQLTLRNGDPAEPPDIVVQATTDGGGQIGINTDTPEEALEVVGTTQTTGFKMPTDAADGYVLTSDDDGNATWQARATGSRCGESGEFDGEVNSDMVEDSGASTVFNFASPFTSIEKPHMHIVVVLKASANGLVEGAAIKAVVDIKGSPGNWTGFDITVSKLSDGSSIDDTTQVYVIWMAMRP